MIEARPVPNHTTDSFVVSPPLYVLPSDLAAGDVPPGWQLLVKALPRSLLTTLYQVYELNLTKHLPHHPLHQVMFGEAIVHHLNQAFADATPRFCLKWPNDVYVQRLDSTWAKCGGILYEMASKGARHRLVVGLGLNATNPPDPVYGCLADVGLQRSVEQLSVEVDAIVASLHSQPKALESGVVERFAEAADACRHGVAVLGPVVVEGQVTEHPALQRLSLIHI